MEGIPKIENKVVNLAEWRTLKDKAGQYVENLVAEYPDPSQLEEVLSFELRSLEARFDNKDPLVNKDRFLAEALAKKLSETVKSFPMNQNLSPQAA